MQRGGEDGIRGADRVETHTRTVGHYPHVRAVDGERRVARGLLDARAEAPEPGVRRRPADPQRRASAGGELEERREVRGREQPAGRAELEVNGSRQHDARLSRRTAKRERAHAWFGHAHRKLDWARRAAERRKLVDEDCLRCSTVEHQAGARGHDDDALRAEREGRVPRRVVDGVRDPPDLVLERTGEGTRRRRHVGAEDVDADPLEPPERREPAPLPPGGVDGSLPVGRDAELGRPDREALAPGREDDGPRGQRGRLPLEQRSCLRHRHAADVDAVDPDTARDRRRRAGEDQAEDDADGDEREHEKNERAAHGFDGIRRCTNRHEPGADT